MHLSEKQIENLTGHLVRVFGKKPLVLPISTKELPIRAKYSETVLQEYPFRVVDNSFKVELSPLELDRLASTYEYILVSKISADCLVKLGYKGNILITGIPMLSKDVAGVKSLVLYHKGEKNEFV